MRQDEYKKGYSAGFDGHSSSVCPWIGFDDKCLILRYWWRRGWNAGYRKRRRAWLKQNPKFPIIDWIETHG